MEARDGFGNRRLTGGDVFEVMVYPPSRDVAIEKFVLQDGPGEYFGSFVSKVKGIHNVLVSLKPVNVDTPIDAQGAIKGSPFSPTFREADSILRAESSRLITPNGAEITIFPKATAGIDMEVLIQAYSCPLPVTCIAKRSGGDVFAVQISEPGGGEGAVNKTMFVKDHSYKEFYDWPQKIAGRYSFLIDGTNTFRRAGSYLVRERHGPCTSAGPPFLSA